MVDILESFCRWQQRWLEVSHYTWLKFFAATHAVVFFVFLFPEVPPNKRLVGWFFIFALLACVPGFIWWERKSLNRMIKGFANPLRKNGWAIYRYAIGYIATTYLVVAMTATALIDPRSSWLGLTLIVWWVTLASLFVLLACDPLPPTAGKWREWVAHMFLKKSFHS